MKLIEYRQRKSEPGTFAFVQMPHILQGYNNCGSTACATFARFQGSDICGWDFKKLCPSPLGTGTDWWHLLDASAKIGQKWKLVTYTPDDDGFEKATAMLEKNGANIPLLLPALEALAEPWTADAIKTILQETATISGKKLGELMPPLRASIVGTMSGPDIPDAMAILGKAETLARLKRAV